MPATGFLTPQIQIFDNNGDPLALGKLYFYQTGTETPQHTYTEHTLTTPNTNPVVLDSAGRAVIYFLQTPAYKCICKTSADVTLWTQDAITPAETAT